jgi:signal transduction histidine kinase/FixJ family two-component response regulator
MRDKTVSNSLKSKVVLGYILIILAPAIAIIFLYNGIKNLQLLDQTNTAPNVKLYKINQILTLIYEAENQTRTYFLLRNKTDFEDYVKTLNKIGENIDTLAVHYVENPQQIKYLNDVKDLLLQKKDVIQQLKEIRSPNKREFLYTRALEEVYIQAYELSKISRIVKEKITITHDTVLQAPQKKSFLKRIFSSDPGSKIPKIVEKETKSDTVIQEGMSPDTLVKTLQHAIENLKYREDYLQGQSLSRETQLLYNDRVLLDKIRNIVTSLETDELASINKAIKKSSSILQNASYTSMLLAIISVLMIVIFLVLIFRDISIGRQHQIALQNAKQQTDELMKLKEQFLANMSHEIRTPLGTIIGFTEQLQKTGLGPKQEKYIETIEKASDHLLSLVNDILDVSKIEAGKLMLEKIRFNLVDLLNEVCQLFSIKAKEKNLEIISQINPELNCGFIGDPFRIRQVLLNIVGNALKFTDEGRITICAEILSKDSQTCNVKISVTDTGIGIAQEQQKKIFEDFLQADSGTARKYGGTGLGLSISRRIIELHGGKISLHSNPGDGSTFIIEIPLQVPGPDDSKLSTSGNYPATGFSSADIFNSIKDKKILVVDDDQTTLALTLSLLNNLNIEAETLSDSTKVIGLLEQKHFDLIVTDIHMPEMSGIELLNLIRLHPNNHINQIPVIASTANITDKEEIIKKGFVDYLSKPFKEAMFYNKILKTLKPEFSGFETPKETNAHTPKSSAPYSLSEISSFVGNDPEAMKLVVSTFVEKSLQTIAEIKELTNTGNVEGISFRVHKLLPSFRQFQINELIDDMLKMERFKEFELPPEEILVIAQRFGNASEVILRKIKKDIC